MKITPVPDLGGMNTTEALRAIAQYRAACDTLAHNPCTVKITFEQAKNVPGLDVTRAKRDGANHGTMYGVPIVITGMTTDKVLALIDDEDYWRSRDKEMMRL